MRTPTALRTPTARRPVRTWRVEVHPKDRAAGRIVFTVQARSYTAAWACAEAQVSWAQTEALHVVEEEQSHA